jgi:hypothetical protein
MATLPRGLSIRRDICSVVGLQSAARSSPTLAKTSCRISMHSRDISSDPSASAARASVAAPVTESPIAIVMTATRSPTHPRSCPCMIPPCVRDVPGMLSYDGRLCHSYRATGPIRLLPEVALSARDNWWIRSGLVARRTTIVSHDGRSVYRITAAARDYRGSSPRP